MACLPASQFCCGCTVTFGVKFILLLNFALNLFIITMSLLFILGGYEGLALASYGNTMIMLAFALGGVPVTIVAFHGVLNRNEPMVRIYHYYMWATIIYLLCQVAHTFLLEDPCKTMQRFMPGSSAWACGMIRYLDIFMVIVSISTLGYFQHVVYSHCQDLAELGGGPELKDLVLNKGHYRAKAPMETAYATVEHMASMESGMADSLGFMLNNELSKGAPIFGSYHSMEYPPFHDIKHGDSYYS